MARITAVQRSAIGGPAQLRELGPEAQHHDMVRLGQSGVMSDERREAGEPGIDVGRLKGSAPFAAQRVNVRLEHDGKVPAVEFLNRSDERGVGGRLERAGPASPYAAMPTKWTFSAEHPLS
jgi:hypothetical protein